MEKTDKIYVAGHRGLVGSAILRTLTDAGYTHLVTRTHDELDLTRQADVEQFFAAERPDIVFLAAARVGGIYANDTYPAEFSFTNLAIQAHTLHAAWRYGVRRLLFLGSSCIYPRECPQPMREDHLLTGPLEPTNAPYAVAKIAGISQCQSYNRQYGTRFLAAMPTNLYGPDDNFDLDQSHVLPAMIRKCHLAKLAADGQWEAVENDERMFGPIPADIRTAIGCPPGDTRKPAGSPEIVLWGTGNPYREFLHVDDLANACLFLAALPDPDFDRLLFPPDGASKYGMPLINIGSGRELTIRSLADHVARIVGFTGKIVWDNGKPDGTPRKRLDNTRLSTLGWRPTISLEEGIGAVYNSYLQTGNGRHR